MSLRNVVYFEYVIGFIICLFIYITLDYSILLFFLLLLVPDVTMIGYLFNPKTGSLVYNIGHSLMLPYILLFIAYLGEFSLLLMVALIWIAHIYLDRSLGFGLKYSKGFKVTHLQKID
ncbi:DUF4260 family protein [Sediminibacillus dalangtanensis]|uniref:DUF4260 family protein n=1 Tax=Sediminibacillus dalangtanensis TaxID=2729421 RepID=A0ABX7VN65_9BACI|nr:DUF4260 domain-containing protein [Sediminibacillus dalangtanensis]QTM98271.1 DUF4260 family protein [Sediminibacillus dalangtanensis]